jgi:hypothetical protein
MKNRKIDSCYVDGLPRLNRMEGFYRSLPSDWPFPRPEFIHGIDAQRILLPKWWTEIPAIYGCNESHRQAIGLALSRGAKLMMLFEDDCRFLPGAAQAMVDALLDVPEDWDSVMFGGQVTMDGKTIPVTPRISKCVQVERSHAYLLSERGMKLFYQELCEPKNIPNDHRWGQMQEDGTLTVYRIEPFVCYQADGFSSISGNIEPARSWDDRSEVRMRDPAEIKIINLICPFDVLVVLRKAGIVANGGSSSPMFDMLDHRIIENGERDIAELALASRTIGTPNYPVYIQVLRNTVAYHRDAMVCLWHPSEVIDGAYPTISGQKLDTVLIQLSLVNGIPSSELRSRCDRMDSIQFIDMMRPNGLMRIGLRNLIEVAVKRGTRMIEIGAFAGASTGMFLDAVGDEGEVVSIDPWNPYMTFDMKKVEQVFDELLDRPALRKIKATSMEGIGELEDGVYDLAYIDGDHAYESVMRDIELVIPKIKADGWIAGHDYSDINPSVKRAVGELFDMAQVRFFEDNSWLAPRSAVLLEVMTCQA